MQITPDTAQGIAKRSGGTAFVLRGPRDAAGQHRLRRVLPARAPRPLRRRTSPAALAALQRRPREGGRVGRRLTARRRTSRTPRRAPTSRRCWTPSASTARAYARRARALDAVPPGPARAARYRDRVPPFRLDSAYTPTADQPQAIDGSAAGVTAGERFTTLLGATGTGKTITMAATIERLQRPALVIAHNKTLAAQLCNEFREFFPDNAVEYFVSYYDYYQPEAYVPSTGPLHREGLGDQRGDRPPAPRRHRRAVRPPRRDHRRLGLLHLRHRLAGDVRRRTCSSSSAATTVDRDELLRKLVSIQYTRNDTALGRGTFRVRGEVLEVFPAYAETAYRVDALRRRGRADAALRPADRRAARGRLEHVAVWPATHYNVKEDTIERAVEEIGARARTRAARSSRPRASCWRRTGCASAPQYDMEMLREIGFCNGIENYSRILDGRRPGDRPYCLIDYFPDDFVCFIDESHQTVPQIGGMYEGDRSPQADAGRLRLPAARARSTTGRRRSTSSCRSRRRSCSSRRRPGQFERAALGARRRADRPPDRDRRPGGRGARDARTRSTT